MSGFGEQIQNRIRNDLNQVSDALTQVADAIDGQGRFRAHETSTQLLEAEVRRICHYFGLNLPDNTTVEGSVNDMIDRLVRPLGIMRRRVALQGDWWKNGDGPLLAVIKENSEMCALIPGSLTGYYYYDRRDERYVRVNASNKDMFEDTAVCFYRPLPNGPVSGRELISFIAGSVKSGDRVLVCLSSLLIVLLSLLVPWITYIVFSRFIPTGKGAFLITTAVLLIALAVGTYLLTTVKTAVMSRISNQMYTCLSSAVFSRILNLPVKFFADKNSGALSQTIASISKLPDILTEVLFGGAVSLLISLLFVAEIAILVPEMLVSTVTAVLLEILLIAVCIYQQIHRAHSRMEADSESQGMVHELFSGIQRIKLSGSENRVFSRWARLYKKKVQATYQLPFPSFMKSELAVAILMLGLFLAFISASYSGITVARFAAFVSAYGMLMNSFQQITSSLEQTAKIGPILKTGEPILQAVPETSPDRKPVEKLAGAIELNNISFSYEEGGPRIFDHMNLKIKAGEYVAIVGANNCGKSTLMRLMLGFETPLEGTVSYDGRDLETLDMAAFRRNVGTVLPGEKLFMDNVYSNITISAPWLRMEDAWQVARMVGMEKDIQNLPDGMQTIVREGSSKISDGQRQKLLIARAIAPGPSILMFDGATSALDNIARKTVCDMLKALDCTRVVSTQYPSEIRECDRILVLDSGKIVEDGTYDELIARNGFFAGLLRRQQMEQKA